MKHCIYLYFYTVVSVFSDHLQVILRILSVSTFILHFSNVFLEDDNTILSIHFIIFLQYLQHFCVIDIFLHLHQNWRFLKLILSSLGFSIMIIIAFILLIKVKTLLDEDGVENCFITSYGTLGVSWDSLQ